MLGVNQELSRRDTNELPLAYARLLMSYRLSKTANETAEHN